MLRQVPFCLQLTDTFKVKEETTIMEMFNESIGKHVWSMGASYIYGYGD